MTNERVWHNILSTRNIKAQEEFYVYFIELLRTIREGPLLKFRINDKTAKKIQEDIANRNFGWARLACVWVTWLLFLCFGIYFLQVTRRRSFILCLSLIVFTALWRPVRRQSNISDSCWRIPYYYIFYREYKTRSFRVPRMGVAWLELTKKQDALKNCWKYLSWRLSSILIFSDK